MKIKCINNTEMEDELTKGKEYKVAKEMGSWYKIEINDKGMNNYCYVKERFEIIEEENKMKFKVGDKVKVREDLVVGNRYGKERFTDWMKKYKGKEIEIEGILKNTYISVGLHWTDEMLEEVKEDKMKKTFKEVIADIKEGEVWRSINRTITMNDIGEIIIKGAPHLQVFNPRVEYRLQRKKYTFDEAFKAYEDEEKEVEDYEGNRYKKINGLDGYYNKFLKEWEVIEHLTLTFDEIRNHWYIND